MVANFRRLGRVLLVPPGGWMSAPSSADLCHSTFRKSSHLVWIRFSLHKEFRAAEISFYLHKELRTARIRFNLHKPLVTQTRHLMRKFAIFEENLWKSVFRQLQANLCTCNTAKNAHISLLWHVLCRTTCHKKVYLMDNTDQCQYWNSQRNRVTS